MGLENTQTSNSSIKKYRLVLSDSINSVTVLAECFTATNDYIQLFIKNELVGHFPSGWAIFLE